MANSEKSFFRQITGALTALLLGAFLASFGLSWAMKGNWGFVLAALGGAATAISIRLVRIKWRGLVPGLMVGYLICGVILMWATVHWNLTVNRGSSIFFLFAVAMVQVLLSDQLLAGWFNIFLAKSSNIPGASRRQN